MSIVRILSFLKLYFWERGIKLNTLSGFKPGLIEISNYLLNVCDIIIIG